MSAPRRQDGAEGIRRDVRAYVPGMRHYVDLLNWRLRELPRRRWIARRRTREERDRAARLVRAYLSIGGDPGPPPWPSPVRPPPRDR